MKAVMPTIVAVILFVVLALAPASAPDAIAVDDPPSRENRGGYVIERLTLDAHHAQHRYRVSVMRPAHPAPERGYPVLFMLDGNAVEQDLGPNVLDSLTVASAPAIVTIGYETAQRFDVAARTYDYTPALTPHGEESDPLNSERRTGGADGFLSFIENTIKPAVAGRIPVDHDRLGIWGHSYGGLFVLNTLLNKPELFRCYVAASPSLWWQNGYLQSRLDVGTKRLSAQRFGVLITRGTAETGNMPASHDAATLARWRIRTSVPPEAARDFAERLRTLPNTEIGYLEFAGLGHGQALTASLAPALQWFSHCTDTPSSK